MLGQWSQMQQRLLGSGCRPSPHGWNTVISRRLAPLGAKIEALLGTISQAGRATAAPVVMPLPSVETKRKRKTTEESAAAQAAKRGPGGIPTYVLAPNKETVARLWEEYTTGLNGGPAVRNLIHDHTTTQTTAGSSGSGARLGMQAASSGGGTRMCMRKSSVA